MRSFARAAGLALFTIIAGALPVDAQGSGPAHQRKDRGSRPAYNNTGDGSVAVHTVGDLQVDAMDLPALLRLDLSTLPPDALRAVDHRVEEAHAATQTSPRCEAIRTASRVPERSWIWQEHQRELLTAAALFAFSLVVGFAWSGRVMRTLMPIAPFAGAIYLGYVTHVRSREAVAEIHQGLRACSADLPEARPTDPQIVKQRLLAADESRLSVQGVFEHREGMLDRLLSSTRH